jgi:hypothetical protein
MRVTSDVVFLVDVDNTLLDSDRIVVDPKRHLEREFGFANADRYWAISMSRSYWRSDEPQPPKAA